MQAPDPAPRWARRPAPPWASDCASLARLVAFPVRAGGQDECGALSPPRVARCRRPRRVVSGLNLVQNHTGAADAP